MYIKVKVIITICLLLSSMSLWSQEVISVKDLLKDTAYIDKLPIPMASITSNIEETMKVIDEVKESLGLTPEQLSRIDSLMAHFANENSKFQNHPGSS